MFSLHFNSYLATSQQMLGFFWKEIPMDSSPKLSIGKENFIEWCCCYPPKHLLSLLEVFFPATDVSIMFMDSEIV